MSEAVAISDDALKLLVAEHGVRGTARLLGMDRTQTDAFRQRVTRGKWLEEPAMAHLRAKDAQQPAPKPIVANVSPMAAVAQEIQALSMRTRVGHAKAAATVADHVSKLEGPKALADMQNIKAAGQHAATVFAWADQQPGSRVRLDVLLSRPEQTIDIQAEVVGDTWDSDVPQDNVEQE